MKYNIIIAGGGAAGLFAAACIKLKPGQHGIILDKAKAPGRKLLMSGAGQCNLTHAGDIKDFVNRYGRNGKKIRSVLFGFSNERVMEWFESNGVPLHTRSDGKVFPVSMDAHDILNTLLRKAEANGFRLMSGCAVKSIKKEENGAFTVGYVSEKNGDNTVYVTSDAVLAACGGCSYPTTGSDGAVFDVLRTAGIEITELSPSLVPLYVENYPYAEISGNAVRNAEVCIYEKDRSKKSPCGTGDVLFTHKNFSGPGVLDMSRYAKRGYTLEISWLPGRNASSVIADLNALRSGNKKLAFTVFSDYFSELSQAHLKILCRRAGIPVDARFSDISALQLQTLAGLITADRFTISGDAGFSVAMATSGGVSLAGVDLKTMQSRDMPGLYFAGEILDIDGDTGGFNLQFAFASAYRAAASLTDTCL